MSNSNLVKYPPNCHHAGSAPRSSDSPAVSVTLSNVVAVFNTRCHLNLKHIARVGVDVEYKPENNMVVMRLRKPYLSASIWSSGKVWCTGSTSIDGAHKGARRVARRIMKYGFSSCKFANYRVVNILASCQLDFGIRLPDMATGCPRQAVYEPELHPALNYTLVSPKATIRVFSTGSLVITAPSVENIAYAVDHIYPVASNYRMNSKDELDRSLHIDSLRRMKRPAQSNWSRQHVTSGADKRAKISAYDSDDDDDLDAFLDGLENEEEVYGDEGQASDNSVSDHDDSE